MKVRLHLIFAFLTLIFVALASDVRACGGNSKANGMKCHQKSSCAKASAETSSTEDHCSCGGGHTGNSCPQDNNCHGCHCPGCGNGMGGLSGAFICTNQDSFTLPTQGASVGKQAFYFADHLPEAVYLAIWQPPKLSA